MTRSAPAHRWVRSGRPAWGNAGVDAPKTRRALAVLRDREDKRYGKTPAQVALRWLIENDTVLPIPGAKTVSRPRRMPRR
jgi:aryl-alcohol dehydrogenase-like predicted oxidoreductase